MSMEHPNILYVGDIERGRALLAAVDAHGGYVFLPADAMEALAMYISYLPDVTVMETSPYYNLAFEVQRHLGSINAQPVIVLANDRLKMWAAFNPATQFLPSDLSIEALIEAVHNTISQRNVQFS